MKRQSVFAALTTAVLCVGAPVIGPVWGDAPRPVSPDLQTVRVHLDTANAPQGGTSQGGTVGATVAAVPQAGETAALRQSDPIQVRDFSLVGATWTGAGTVPDIEVRVAKDGQWQDWEQLPRLDAAPDPSAPDAAAAVTSATDSLWVGDSDTVQVRVGGGAESLAGIDLELVDPGTSSGAAAQPLATAGAAATRPPIIPRAQWGADESLKCGSVSYMKSVKAATIHHTAGGNSYSTQAQAMAQLRADYAYHTKVLRWCDLGYNFVVDKWGNIYEGRAGGVDKAVQGAHAGGFNAGTVGISALGNYSAAAAPAAMVNAISRVTAWKLGMYGANPLGSVTLTSAGGGTAKYAAGRQVTLPVIFGHRDVGYTECPGNNLYAQLPAIRNAVKGMLQGSAPAPAPVPSGPYGGWQSLGGGIIGRPAAVTPAAGRLDVVAVGVDKTLYHRAYAGRWSSWQQMGGSTDGSPAVSSWGTDREDIFVRGGDKALWQRTYENGRWGGWKRIGGALASSPAAVSSRPGRIDVLAQGTDKALWHVAYDNGSWGKWVSLGGVTASAPAVTSDGPGRVDAVVVGKDREVWHRSLRNGWTPWLQLGGQTTADPAVTAPRAGVLEVAVTGTDGQVRRRAYSKGWQAWSVAGGRTPAGPALASAGDGVLNLLARGTDNAVWLTTGRVS